MGNPREEVVYFDRDLSWELQVYDLVKCIREDAPVTDSSTLDALKVMEIIDGVYRQENVRTAGPIKAVEGGER